MLAPLSTTKQIDMKKSIHNAGKKNALLRHMKLEDFNLPA
jgi:hypothetical protein